jgi:hypothetical protein
MVSIEVDDFEFGIFRCFETGGLALGRGTQTILPYTLALRFPLISQRDNGSGNLRRSANKKALRRSSTCSNRWAELSRLINKTACSLEA